MTRIGTGVWLGAVLAAVAAAPAARAEIEVIVPDTAQFLAPMVAPKIPSMAGWTTDPALSLAQHVKVLFPDDQSSASMALVAEPREPAAAGVAVDTFAGTVEQAMRRADPVRTYADAGQVTSAGGQTFRLIAFTAGNGAIGVSAYGVESSGGRDYWLRFVLSAGDQTTLERFTPAFRDMLARYK